MLPNGRLCHTLSYAAIIHHRPTASGTLTSGLSQVSLSSSTIIATADNTVFGSTYESLSIYTDRRMDPTAPVPDIHSIRGSVFKDLEG